MRDGFLLLEQNGKYSGVDAIEPPVSSGGIAYPLYAEPQSLEVDPGSQESFYEPDIRLYVQ